MIRSKEEIISAFSAIIGETNTDEVISFTEDLSDTLDGIDTDYKTKYEEAERKFTENDEAWRKKYRERFNKPVDISDPEPEPDPEPRKYTFEELFKEV